jgi:hypothetical protein
MTASPGQLRFEWFACHVWSIPANSSEFGFNAAEGASYRIEGSTDLENWGTVETGIIGSGGVVIRFYSTESQPKRYFRARRI